MSAVIAILVTVVSGVLVLVLGQAALRLVLEPPQNYREQVSRLAALFVEERRGLIGDASERLLEKHGYTAIAEEVHQDLTTMMGRLVAAKSRIMGNRHVRRLAGLRSDADFHEAIVILRGMRNSIANRRDDYGRIESRDEVLSKQRRKLFGLLKMNDPMVGDRDVDHPASGT